MTLITFLSGYAAAREYLGAMIPVAEKQPGGAYRHDELDDAAVVYALLLSLHFASADKLVRGGQVQWGNKDVQQFADLIRTQIESLGQRDQGIPGHALQGAISARRAILGALLRFQIPHPGAELGVRLVASSPLVHEDQGSTGRRWRSMERPQIVKRPWQASDRLIPVHPVCLATRLRIHTSATEAPGTLRSVASMLLDPLPSRSEGGGMVGAGEMAGPRESENHAMSRRELLIDRISTNVYDRLYQDLDQGVMFVQSMEGYVIHKIRSSQTSILLGRAHRWLDLEAVGHWGWDWSEKTLVIGYARVEGGKERDQLRQLTKKAQAFVRLRTAAEGSNGTAKAGSYQRATFTQRGISGGDSPLSPKLLVLLLEPLDLHATRFLATRHPAAGGARIDLLHCVVSHPWFWNRSPVDTYLYACDQENTPPEVWQQFRDTLSHAEMLYSSHPGGSQLLSQIRKSFGAEKR